MKLTRPLALGVVLLQAACVPTVSPPAEPVDACGASEYQYLVGKPGVVLDGMRFSQDVRVIQYGMPVTMDYRLDRLNFRLDQRDVIQQVVCG